MQRNNYLDRLGITPENYGTNFCRDRKRAFKWKRQRKKYGFDSRECWNLDKTFMEWLYSHLMLYREEAIADLNYHKFIFKNKEYAQIEAIDFILERLERALIANYKDWNSYNEEEVKEAIEMWSEIFMACWW